MSIRLRNLSIGLDYSPEVLLEAVARALREAPEKLLQQGALPHLEHLSLDARHKNGPHYVAEVQLDLPMRSSYSRYADVEELPPPPPPYVPRPWQGPPPIIAGSGPAGLFAAYELALAGARPVILERGGPVPEREKAVDAYWSGEPLDPENNVQFGEGGAGTFSDGKLTSRIHDPLTRLVLERFIEWGAPADILFRQKPHIGTDLLRGILLRMRQAIEDLGGSYHFHTRVEGLLLAPARFQLPPPAAAGLELPGTPPFSSASGTASASASSEGRVIKGVHSNRGDFYSDTVFLALGHSSRDTFTALAAQQVPMEAKAFAVGFRLEHPQSLINRARYGKLAEDPRLPAAEYQLAEEGAGGRRIYTFCMCPGGEVVAAASAAGHLVSNGMSQHARAGENANAAVLCPVDAGIYGEGLFAGMNFQETLEQQAFQLTEESGLAPACRLDDFLEGREPQFSAGLAERSENYWGSTRPTYRPGVCPTAVASLFPEKMQEAYRAGLLRMGKKMPGFLLPEAVLTAPESRSSSPLRILRDKENRMSSGISGLYPIGEGAGYAGGITSSAVDGMRSARAAIERVL